MNRGRGDGRDDFPGFGNPFSSFGDPFSGFQGFRRPGSLISSFFGGRDPFDDPFFTQPFGGMIGSSMFSSRMFTPGPSFHGEIDHSGFLEDSAPISNKSKGPIIKELSDNEEEGDDANKNAEDQKDSGRKHHRSNEEPQIQEPDDEKEEKRIRNARYSQDYNSRTSLSQPQAQSYSFTSVTYGGRNGAYYTSSTSRRTGGDGLIVEESKEADTTTGRASHRLSRGIHDKGHTVTRNLNSDGHVHTMQTLHNINEDELAGFDDAWKGRARQQLPEWNPHTESFNDRNFGDARRRNGNADHPGLRGWALPSSPLPPCGGTRRQ